MTTSGILLIVAVVLFVLAAVPAVQAATRINLVALGLAAFAGAFLFGGALLPH